MFILWGVFYVQMTKAYIRDNKGERKSLFRNMEVYKLLNHPFWWVIMVISLGVTWIYPPFVLIFTACSAMFNMFNSKNRVEGYCREE